MKHHLSIYLDAIRFIAALTVFIGHFSLQHLSGGQFWQAQPYADEAVVVFFVLSGFVIAHATHRRQTAAADYCISRAARIYSVVLPALALTVLLDLIGNRLFPAHYSAGSWGFDGDLSLLRLVSGVSFTNEFWGLHVRQGSNVPFWSLGYEVPYYLIFGLAIFATGPWRIVALSLALLAVGPSILMLLPIWLAGVAAYHCCKRELVGQRAGLMLLCASVGAWVTYEAIAWKFGRPSNSATFFVKRATLVQDYFVAAVFVAHIVGFNASARWLTPLLSRIAVPVRWLAGASFSLYLLHYPIVTFLFACMPWPGEDPRSRFIGFACTLAFVFLVASFTERQKNAWRGFFATIWRTVARR